MTLWVIYHNQSDHPGKFVVRRWWVGESISCDRHEILTDTLDSARQWIPAGLYRVGRRVDDDSSLAEAWI